MVAENGIFASYTKNIFSILYIDSSTQIAKKLKLKVQSMKKQNAEK